MYSEFLRALSLVSVHLATIANFPGTGFMAYFDVAPLNKAIRTVCYDNGQWDCRLEKASNWEQTAWLQTKKVGVLAPCFYCCELSDSQGTVRRTILDSNSCSSPVPVSGRTWEKFRTLRSSPEQVTSEDWKGSLRMSDKGSQWWLVLLFAFREVEQTW